MNEHPYVVEQAVLNGHLPSLRDAFQRNVVIYIGLEALYFTYKRFVIRNPDLLCIPLYRIDFGAGNDVLPDVVDLFSEIAFDF